MFQTMFARSTTRGFTPVRVERSTPAVLTVLVEERSSEQLHRLELAVSEIDATAVIRHEWTPVPRPPGPGPPGLEIRRVSLPAALPSVSARADAAAFSGVLLVSRGERMLLHRAWGVADEATGRRVQLNTRFQLASVSKMLTAIAVLQLVERGILRLEGTVGEYLPAYP